MDGIVCLLATLLAVDTASMVFVSIAPASVAVAPLALNLALFGRVTPIALIGLRFVHSSTVDLAFGHAGEQKIWPHPEYHIPFLALKTKQVYMPYLFTAANIVMRYAPAYENLQRSSKGPVLKNHASPDWQALLTSYDYALLVNDQLFDTPVPGELVPVVQEGKVRLYRNSLRN